MDVLELTDRLHHLVHSAKKVPLRDQLRVNRQEIRDILDQMRAAIPAEIKEAHWIAQERQDILAQARREAEQIAAETRERQSQLASHHELIRQSEHAAEEIIEDARAREHEIRQGANDYADEILNTFELNLAKFIAAIQRGRDRLRRTNEHAEHE
jgi:cell division septum initiation protein DivIVA